MNKFITALAMTLSLAAIPSFAQYEEDYQEGAPEYDAEGAPEASTEGAPEANASSYDDTYVASEPEAAPQAVQQSDDAEPFKISTRLGGRIAIGFGGADDLTNLNVDLTGTLRIYLNEKLALAPEVGFAFRSLTRTYATERVSGGYYYDYDDSFNQILLDIPLLARYEPIPYLYVEGGLKLGINMASFYSDDYTCYNYSGEVQYSGSYDTGDWDASSVYASLVLGAGGRVKANGRDVDVGVRFMLDLNGEDFGYNYVERGDTKVKYMKVGSGHIWALQLSMTYLL